MDKFFGAVWLVIALLVACSARPSMKNQHHIVPEEWRRPDMGWQEPGLWRPKWIMTRQLIGPKGSNIIDRICFRLNTNKSLRIFNSRTRPKLSFGRDVEAITKPKLNVFSEDDSDVKALRSFNKARESGSWLFRQVTSFPDHAKVIMEIKDGPGDERNQYEVVCKFGKLDGYSVKFKEGKITRVKYSNTGVPVSFSPMGTFSVSVLPHRPVVFSDMAAFQ